MSEEKCKVYNLFKNQTLECSFDLAGIKNLEVPDDVWQCNCGCHLFYVNFEGWTCSNCGTYQIFKD